MTSQPFDYGPLLRKDAPAAAVRWTGFAEFNFIGGHNDADNIPVAGLIEAATSVLKREGATLATYGLQSGPQGYKPLREFISARLRRYAGIDSAPEDVLVTSGSNQGLDLINQTFVAPGDTVLIEEASYSGAINRLKKCGARLVRLPLDGDGIRMDGLEAALKDLAAKGIKPKLIYTIPTVQNPTGSIMPEARRHEMLAIARRHGVPIVEDECYSDLVWSGKRPPAIYALAKGDGVIHVGSFSKSIAPALRLGYVVAGWPVLSRLIASKTDAGTGALEQMVLAEFCARHFDDHVARLTPVLEGKLDALTEALGEQFGTSAEFVRPKGGIFLWIRLPAAVDTSKLAQTALAAGIAYNPGAEWSHDMPEATRHLRVCFANPSKQQLREGVAALAEVCRRETGLPARIANVDRARR
jgi:2-aminoadipate transaminase